ncbi:Protein TolB, partial [termite gut metagenome]
SYNIPEFITGKVKKRSRELGLKAKNDRGINVSFPLLP